MADTWTNFEDEDRTLLDKVFVFIFFAFVCVLVFFSLYNHFLYAAENAEPRIRIKEFAICNGKQVVISDIAVPDKGIAPDLWEKFAGLEVFPAPEKSGGQMLIPRERMREYLSAVMKDAVKIVAFPPQTYIRFGGKLLEAAELKKMAVEFLTGKFSPTEGELEIRDLRLPSHIFISDDDRGVDIDMPGGIKSGNASFRYVVRNHRGDPTRKYSATAFVDYWKSVPCAARPINPLEELLPEHVRYVRKNLSYLRGEPWDGKTFGVRLKKPVGENQPIFKDNVEPLPVIAKGSKVTLLFERGTIRLAVEVEALSDGSTGETISVRNLQSKKEVKAVVRDAQTVVVK